MKTVLAFDYGASSGRAILFRHDGDEITAEEIYRFDNVPVRKNGTLYWDFAALTGALSEGISIATAKGGFDSIGIDTWGVDFGLLDENGELIDSPVHYRDDRTDNVPDEVFKVVPKDELYRLTGVQIQQYNTIFQLYYVKNHCRELYARAKKMLLMPDLLAYFLTGKTAAERTIASTTGLTDAVTKDWSDELIARLGFERSLFPDIIESGESYGVLKKEIAERYGIPQVPVIAVCCHDTASAIFSVPAGGHPLYLSCGTWSLLGTLTDSPVVTPESFAANFTNETGYDKTTRYLKNIMGLWIINECRREWSKARKLSFSEIVQVAKSVGENKYLIDVDDDVFLKPDDMPEKIRAYCSEKYGSAPSSVGEIARCVYESLCLKYSRTIAEVSRASGRAYDTFYVVGGGCKAEYLCQMIASRCGIKVSAGPVEATAIGNALVQFIALGVEKNDDELKKRIADNFDIKVYEP